MFFLSLLLLFVAVNAQMNTTDMPANDSLALCTVETEMVDCSARGYCLEKEEALDENAADTNSDGSYDTTGMSCFCDDGYTTYYSDDYENYPQCNYKQKEQLVAFLLSLFVGTFGGGRWYVEDYVLAPIKMCIIFAGCILSCICCCCFGGVGVASKYSKVSSNSGEFLGVGVGAMSTCIMCCTTFAVLAWWIADLILFGTNQIEDGNGVKLASW